MQKIRDKRPKRTAAGTAFNPPPLMVLMRRVSHLGVFLLEVGPGALDDGRQSFDGGYALRSRLAEEGDLLIARAHHHHGHVLEVAQLVEAAMVFPREPGRSEEHTSELQSRQYLVCTLLLEKKMLTKDGLTMIL